MHPDDMKRRTKEFAKRVIWLCRELPPTREGRRIGDQLFQEMAICKGDSLIALRNEANELVAIWFRP
jgi:hypothetical protein